MDVGRFRTLIHRAKATTEVAAEARWVREALNLWRGTALADVPSRSLRAEYVAALDESRMQALERWFELDLLARRGDRRGEGSALNNQPEVVEEIYGVTGGLEAHLVNRMPAGTKRPEQTAADLDRWALAHAAAEGREPSGSISARPVSGGMSRMDPLMELVGPLMNRSAAVHDEFMGPPPHLMAEIAERRALLWERAATDGGIGGRPVRDARKNAAEERERAADYRAKDAHLKAAAEVQTPDEHTAEHARRWPHEIWGPYRLFPDLATTRDWCAHCNIWISR
ncbi:BTAD domain-containing putative transcriptional regulator [Nonomuraea sp. NPDC059007]|uniref:AfsR/SARP family transcriptional regulator n=1 Tax=Nonomuraea sp. NPDC059007 TaxID=3346692 RepID=UPI0036AAD1C7